MNAAIATVRHRRRTCGTGRERLHAVVDAQQHEPAAARRLLPAVELVVAAQRRALGVPELGEPPRAPTAQSLLRANVIFYDTPSTGASRRHPDLEQPVSGARRSTPWLTARRGRIHAGRGLGRDRRSRRSSWARSAWRSSGSCNGTTQVNQSLTVGRRRASRRTTSSATRATRAGPSLALRHDVVPRPEPAGGRHADPGRALQLEHHRLVGRDDRATS